MSSESAEATDNICVVCFKNVEIFSIGTCDHMVCYECSTRMRVLCRQNECPICRQELPRVIFTCDVKPFSEIQNCSALEDKKFKICFENKKIQDAFYKLLEHSCSICPNHPLFRTFQILNEHVKKQHNLYYCDLCVEHLKIFTFERQCYTNKDLDQHKRKGDVNDRSHRGHPLCQFCDVRYMDNDCLYRHLRRDHLFCHFCDADGLDLYYSSYDYLREHFQTEHYLCEEGTCIDEKFTRVFRTEIDLKAHRASVHGRTLGKAAAKQARTLELEFTLKPRPRQGDSSKKGKPSQNDSSFFEGAVGGVVEQQLQCSKKNLPNLDSSEFPSLPSGSNFTPAVLPQSRGRNNGMAIQFLRRNAPLDMTEENFPVLGVSNDSSASGTSVKSNNNLDRGGGGECSGESRNISAYVNHKTAGEQKVKIKQNDFPSLSSTKNPQPNPPAVNWAKISNKKPEAPTPAKRSPKTLKLNKAEDFPSLNSKFNANLNLKSNEPTKTNFVNVKTYKGNSTNKSDSGNAKKATTSATVENSRSETSDLLSVASISKAKSKKKKSKSNNVEEKSDTAKKKSVENVRVADPKVHNEKSPENSQSSALNLNKSNDKVLEKPLPGVEDWFGDLRKKGGGESSKGESEDSEEFNFTSADPFSGSNPLNFLLKKQNPEKWSGSSSKNNGDSSSGSGSNSRTNPSGVANDRNVFKKCSEGTKVPPPGFDSICNRFNGSGEVKRPPPGFSGNSPFPSNGLTFLNGPGQSFSVLGDFEYTPPADFDRRNQKLVAIVNKIIKNDASLDQFRKQSLLFRQNQLTAEEYYEHCTKAMDERGLREVFPELLVLLPDIRKQQELFRVYSDSPNFPKGANGGGKDLDVCVTCRQVIGANDAKHHFLNHSIERDFPVLKTDWTK